MGPQGRDEAPLTINMPRAIQDIVNISIQRGHPPTVDDMKTAEGKDHAACWIDANSRYARTLEADLVEAQQRSYDVWRGVEDLAQDVYNAESTGMTWVEAHRRLLDLLPGASG